MSMNKAFCFVVDGGYTGAVYPSCEDALKALKESLIDGEDVSINDIKQIDLNRLNNDLQAFNEDKAGEIYIIEACIKDLMETGRIELRDVCNVPHVFDVEKYIMEV